MTLTRRLPLLVAAEGIVLSLLVVWFGETIVGLDWSADELVPRLVRTFLAALPFAILSFSSRNQLRSKGKAAEAEVLGAAVVVTAGFILLWGWYLLGSVRPARGGANIGMGIIMLLSPFILASLIPLGHWLGSRFAGSTLTR